VDFEGEEDSRSESIESSEWTNDKSFGRSFADKAGQNQMMAMGAVETTNN